MVQKEGQENKTLHYCHYVGLLVCVEESISFLYDIVEGRIPKLSTVLGKKNDD